MIGKGNDAFIKGNNPSFVSFLFFFFFDFSLPRCTIVPIVYRLNSHRAEIQTKKQVIYLLFRTQTKRNIYKLIFRCALTQGLSRSLEDFNETKDY